MYCTIRPETPSSTVLSPDAREAHQRLSRHAAALGSLSASFAVEALAVADAYAVALAGGQHQEWASFVSMTAALAWHSASVAAVVTLNAREREADAYFAQIVRENVDLLIAGSVSHAA